ncbi:MAG: hypothetical protein SOX25_04660 [Eubacteriales bacterium]|nr:hypothetical protein [Eubacteriales bacterium]
MSRSDELLREACAQIAEAETDALARHASPALTREAEELYRRHRRHVFRLIEKNSKKHSRPAVWLRAAACFVLMAGVVFLALHQRQPDHNIPLSPGPSASIAPFTAVPTATPAPAATAEPTPTVTPEPTELPYETAISEVTPVSLNSSVQYFNNEPAEINGEPEEITEAIILPTPARTPQPVPTQAENGLECWPGLFFPAGMAIQPEQITLADDYAVYTCAGEHGPILFTEYAAAALLSPVPNGAQQYVALNGVVALMETANGQTTLTWSMDGHTLVLTASAEDAERIALTVGKIAGR